MNPTWSICSVGIKGEIIKTSFWQRLFRRKQGAKLKRDWERTTRQCEYSRLRPELKSAIDAALKEIAEELEIAYCIQTVSTRIRPGGLFDSRRKALYHAVIITPRWLIQAIDPADGKTEPLVVFNSYHRMEITDDTVQACRKYGVEDYGIDIVSQTHRDMATGSYFIGLEPGGDTNKFLSTLKLYIRSANLHVRKPGKQ